MSELVHRIRRQVLEVHLQNRDAAWRLQSDLSRLQRSEIERIIDRCCSECGAPDRIHRIDRLVVDLGQIHFDDFERGLVDRLGPSLRAVLSARIREEDASSTRKGADPEATSRLELIAVFALTGNLPWWADAMRPRLLDESIEFLLRRGEAPLIALLQKLAAHRSALRRIVIHCTDARLWALFGALAPAAMAGARPTLAALLALRSVESAGEAVGSRHAVWLSVLKTAAGRVSADEGPASFWREALAHLALESGFAYGAVLARLRAIAPSGTAGAMAPLAEVLTHLQAEVRGEPPTLDSADVSSTEDALETGPARGILTALRALVRSLEAALEPGALSATALARRLEVLVLAGLPEEATAAMGDLLRETLANARTGDLQQGEPVALLGDATNLRMAKVAELLTHTLERVERITASVPREDAAAAPGTEVRAARPPAANRGEESSRSGTVKKRADSIEHDVALSVEDAAEVYVDNAGVVVLWPFLERLFERLDLFSEGRFKDRAAIQRAVGLLQHLASGERAPVEYQLPLAKVLCGMEMTEVFDFGAEVTDAEAEECADMLTAAIANAPILHEMSIDGFRGSFLLRHGVLSTRDGAWLLRVERVSYDVVLDRFPWGLAWVKLPWMEAPLCVEW